MKRQLAILLGLGILTACSGSGQVAPFDPSKVAKTGGAATNTSGAAAKATTDESSPSTLPADQAPTRMTWNEGMASCYNKDGIYLYSGDNKAQETSECRNFVAQVFQYIPSLDMTIYKDDMRGLAMNSDMTLPFASRFGSSMSSGSGYGYGYNGGMPGQNPWGALGRDMAPEMRGQMRSQFTMMSNVRGGPGAMIPFQSSYYQANQGSLMRQYCNGNVYSNGPCNQRMDSDRFLASRHIMSGLDDCRQAIEQGEPKEKIIYRLERLEPQVNQVAEESPSIRDDFRSLGDSLRQIPGEVFSGLARQTSAQLRFASRGMTYGLQGAAQTWIPRAVGPIGYGIDRYSMSLMQRFNAYSYSPVGACGQEMNGYRPGSAGYQCICADPRTMQTPCQ
jgi:hypothetical protein